VGAKARIPHGAARRNPVRDRSKIQLRPARPGPRQRHQGAEVRDPAGAETQAGRLRRLIPGTIEKARIPAGRLFLLPVAGLRAEMAAVRMAWRARYRLFPPWFPSIPLPSQGGAAGMDASIGWRALSYRIPPCRVLSAVRCSP